MSLAATSDLSPVRIRTLAEITATNARRPHHRRWGGAASGAATPAETGSLRLVDDFGPVRNPMRDLPDPTAWVSRIGLALFEASIGARPATQVMRWLGPEVYDSVVRRSGRAARTGRATRRPVRLRRVHARPVPAGSGAAVVEACMVFDDHRRVRVMALRLEGLDGRWLVTACEIG